ncbi:MAG TPA: copper resistance protein CopC [Gaiellales bacterium]|jgi:copper transport protein
MTRLGRGVAALAVVVLVALAAPAAAYAHAYLVKTTPTPGAILDVPPRSVALTYDEAVEPRFAIISVTNARGEQLTTAPVHRSPSNPDTLIVPLKPHLPSGWYLIYWRAISVDGHPVQGGFTFAVGPNPGPQPQFVIPSIAETATATNLLVARWVMFLSVMIAIGLFAFRTLIARPLVRRVEGASLRAVTVAACAVAAVSLVAIPVYLDIATSVDSLRSPFAVSALVPLFRVTAFGRAYVDLEICMALFCAAAAVALWVDRPRREHRSLAEIFALAGALAAAASVLLVPGLAGHAAQTAPRGLSLLLDWLHLVSGSLWLGGLVGLLILWASLPPGRRVAGLSVCVPRFSNVAFCSVLVLLGSGVGATLLHIPVLNALWTTSYGVAILVKIGLLTAAMLLGAINLLRTKPRLAAAREHSELGEAAARLLRRTVSGETVLVTAAVLAAAILSSLPPPAAALAQLGESLATVGPGRVAAVVHQDGYTLKLLVSPNTPAAPNSFALQMTKGGHPLAGADVTLTFEMLDMQMGNEEYQLTETSPGVYSHSAPALVMAGRWGLLFNITPKQGNPFTAFVVDKAGG